MGVFTSPWPFLLIPRRSTLPAPELAAGLVEVIKYGVIKDTELFEYIEKSLYDILQLNHNALLKIIATSCQIKANVVEEDEKEKHLRAILNYGHTIGHAIETVTNYKKIPAWRSSGRRHALCHQGCC